ncbi:hypothetical protein SAMN04515667_1065 [Formosa sp. Hel1_31_208]|uniref:hypothetical protein n=1 Tax=Formosa sp. Hel1_31_208 TaxID=1798225 RepID=UPI00087C31C3|nr:hypothetical protein [Formosa sp. Hel1_31_208]SDR95149.1 hypothetical protein SAMN04515667_1065 [Formosa sp. Hel1_31_208]
MKQFITLICILTLCAACRTESKDQESTSEIISEEKKELTIAEKIAQAHGFDNWKNVNDIQFTFNVDRGDSHFERSWEWYPKTDDVTLTLDNDIIKYNRTVVDSAFVQTDKSFINDKFWFLAPFQLVWDDGTTISEAIKEVAPMSKIELNKITITYGNEGGYTPGDAYDFYFNDDYIIQEWVYRKGNSESPSMTTTFENYEDFNGLKIAKEHKMTEGNFNLYFSNISVH